MTARDMTPGEQDRWHERVLRYLVTGLSIIGHMNVLFCGMLPRGVDPGPGPAPLGFPRHPERLAAHCPPSAVELALWRDLGWVDSPRGKFSF